ncbi:hypothetical protein PCE1_001494 [Barthelona sp. PCE]
MGKQNNSIVLPAIQRGSRPSSKDKSFGTNNSSSLPKLKNLNLNLQNLPSGPRHYVKGNVQTARNHKVRTYHRRLPPTNNGAQTYRRMSGSKRPKSRHRVVTQPEGVEDKKTSANNFMRPNEVLRDNPNSLTDYEKQEILNYNEIYFLGSMFAKARTPGDFDDNRGDYEGQTHDHIAYRYELMSLLGKGSFGRVYKVLDHKTNEIVALKMIRNKKRFQHQGLVEVKLLEYMRDHGAADRANIVKLTSSFKFRGHLCLVTELLSQNLYEFMKENNFTPMSLSLIRRFSIQILNGMRFMARANIVHADMKPENILLKQANKSGIKIIDFGSGCFSDERIYTYIQSRFYRAPEVILGLAYGCEIDMWSLGCILAEFHTGYPLFPGETENDQIQCIMEVCDIPPIDMIESSPRRRLFFDSKGRPRITANSRGKKHIPATKTLSRSLRTNNQTFIDFIEKCLIWDPTERMTPSEALRHPFITNSSQKNLPPL